MLIAPYGGPLVDLFVPPEEAPALGARASRFPSLQLPDRVLHDLEWLATGGFSPLDRFMGRADFERVVGEMRQASGRLFPIPVPVTLCVPRGEDVHLDRPVALRDARNDLLGVMTLEETYPWDREAVTGIDDPYEPPENPEIILDTEVSTPEDNARRIIEHLAAQGFVR